MICELKHEGQLYRFKIGWVYNKSRYGTPDEHRMDFELSCISEEYPDKLKLKVFDHFQFKKYVNDGIIKILN